jgi:hypothetical protein
MADKDSNGPRARRSTSRTGGKAGRAGKGTRSRASAAGTDNGSERSSEMSATEMPGGQGMSGPGTGDQQSSASDQAGSANGVGAIGARMYADETGGEMPGTGGAGGAGGGGERQRVIVEMRVPRGVGSAFALDKAAGPELAELDADMDYAPVPIKPPDEAAAALDAGGEEIVVVRGMVEPGRIADLERRPGVVRVLPDVEIQPFAAVTEAPRRARNCLPASACRSPRRRLPPVRSARATARQASRTGRSRTSRVTSAPTRSAPRACAATASLWASSTAASRLPADPSSLGRPHAASTA